MLNVKLTAPPPQSGLVIKFSAQVTASHGEVGGLPAVLLPSSSITMNTESYGFPVPTYGVSSPTWVTITASSDLLSAGDARHVALQVLPATLQSISVSPDHFSNVPLGGQQAKVTVFLNGYHGYVEMLDLQYGGDTQITGPAHVGFPHYTNATDFTVTVSPCSVQPTCTVFVKARYHGTEKQTSATVTH
jgi:hypothetical protein